MASAGGRLIIFPVTGAAPPDTVQANGATLPQFLPGAQSIILTRQLGEELSDARVEVLSLKDRKPRVLVSDAADARYVSTGHLVFARQGTLMAVPSNLSRLETTANPVVMLSDVMQSQNGTRGPLRTGSAQVAISTTGALAYLAGGITPDRPSHLLSLDRRGAETPLDFAGVHRYQPFRLSPDGKLLAATIAGI